MASTRALFAPGTSAFGLKSRVRFVAATPVSRSRPGIAFSASRQTSRRGPGTSPRAPQHPDGNLQGPTRLNKTLAWAGVCSRRAADNLVLSGQVTVNGSVVTEPGSRVDLSIDNVTVQGRDLSASSPSHRFYFAVNKPKGYLCSSQPSQQEGAGRGGAADRLVLSLLDPWLKEWRAHAPKGVLPPRLFTVGRLDVQSVGLVFVTNDGDWAQRVMHPSSGVTREYCVTLSRRPSANELRRLCEGIQEPDGSRLAPLAVSVDHDAPRGRGRVRLALGEGKNREVRRLAEAAGLTVLTLRRTRIGGYRLDSRMPVGAYTVLGPREVRRITDLGAQHLV